MDEESSKMKQIKIRSKRNKKYSDRTNKKKETFLNKEHNEDILQHK